MKENTVLDKYTFSGTPKKIGEQHGSAMRDKIKLTFDIYREYWQLPIEKIEQIAQKYLAVMQIYAPDLHEELVGIANGSGMPPTHIMALNARTELRPGFMVAECTAVGIMSKEAGYPLCAQNWDWLRILRGLMSVVTINSRLDKPDLLMLIEPGFLGKFGLNSDGVGVCLNFLLSDNNPIGLSVHTVSRLILDERTAVKAVGRVCVSPRSASIHYLIGDKSDMFFSLEATSQGTFLYEPKHNIDKFMSHTNSYRCLNEKCERQALFGRVLNQEGLNESGVLKALVTNGVLAPKVSNPYDVETVHTILMNLKERTLKVSDGCRSTGFETFSL